MLLMHLKVRPEIMKENLNEKMGFYLHALKLFGKVTN